MRANKRFWFVLVLFLIPALACGGEEVVMQAAENMPVAAQEAVPALGAGAQAQALLPAYLPPMNMPPQLIAANEAAFNGGYRLLHHAMPMGGLYAGEYMQALGYPESAWQPMNSGLMGFNRQLELGAHTAVFSRAALADATSYGSGLWVGADPGLKAQVPHYGLGWVDAIARAGKWMRTGGFDPAVVAQRVKAAEQVIAQLAPNEATLAEAQRLELVAARNILQYETSRLANLQAISTLPKGVQYMDGFRWLVSIQFPADPSEVSAKNLQISRGVGTRVLVGNLDFARANGVYYDINMPAEHVVKLKELMPHLSESQFIALGQVETVTTQSGGFWSRIPQSVYSLLYRGGQVGERIFAAVPVVGGAVMAFTPDAVVIFDALDVMSGYEAAIASGVTNLEPYFWYEVKANPWGKLSAIHDGLGNTLYPEWIYESPYGEGENNPWDEISIALEGSSQFNLIAKQGTVILCEGNQECYLPEDITINGIEVDFLAWKNGQPKVEITWPAANGDRNSASGVIGSSLNRFYGGCLEGVSYESGVLFAGGGQDLNLDFLVRYIRNYDGSIVRVLFRPVFRLQHGCDWP